MDQTFSPYFYSSNTMTDYGNVSTPPLPSFFSTTLPSIINIDPISSYSSTATYNLSFPPSSTIISADRTTNRNGDMWGGSSIATLRR